MDNFADMGREYWDDGASVQSMSSYGECCDYFDKTMKGFTFLAGRNVGKVDLAHRCIKIGSGQVDFVQLHCGGQFRVDQPDEFDYYYLKLILKGQCEVSTGDETVAAVSGQAVAVNPFGSLVVRWNGICEQILIRIDRNALEQTLSEELDIEISDPLRFAVIATSADASRPVAALVDLLRRDADAAGVFATWRLGRQFERLIHLAALQCFPNNYSDTLKHANSMIAPYYVRKAEEHLRAHLREDITIDDLARVTGVSTRSLFYGFRRWRNTTPMVLLKKLRLDVARVALREGSRTGASVTDVATSVGYWHLSRFSSEYKSRFGETPSTTLRRG